ncbi:MAG: hypothetical protein AMXMBFR47_24660 [Planctomycetota bacterium]
MAALPGAGFRVRGLGPVFVSPDALGVREVDFRVAMTALAFLRRGPRRPLPPRRRRKRIVAVWRVLRKYRPARRARLDDCGPRPADGERRTGRTGRIWVE